MRTPERCLCGASDCPRCYGSDAGRFRHQQRVEDAFDELAADPAAVQEITTDFWDEHASDAAIELLRQIAYGTPPKDGGRAAARAILDPMIRGRAEAHVEESYE